MKTIFVDWYIKKNHNDGRRPSGAVYTISKIHKVRVPRGMGFSQSVLAAAGLRTHCHLEVGTLVQFISSEEGIIYRIKEREGPTVKAKPPHLCKHCFKGATL